MTLNTWSTPLLVVAGALRRDDRWLMQQRPAHKAHGGLYEFPGGKVEPGEHPAAALARELDEELDIRVDASDCHPLGFATSDAPDARPLVMLLYRVARWQGEPRAVEASALVWEPAVLLARRPMPPVDVPLVAMLAGWSRG